VSWHSRHGNRNAFHHQYRQLRQPHRRLRRRHAVRRAGARTHPSRPVEPAHALRTQRFDGRWPWCWSWAAGTRCLAAAAVPRVGVRRPPNVSWPLVEPAWPARPSIGSSARWPCFCHRLA